MTSGVKPICLLMRCCLLLEVDAACSRARKAPTTISKAWGRVVCWNGLTAFFFGTGAAAGVVTVIGCSSVWSEPTLTVGVSGSERNSKPKEV